MRNNSYENRIQALPSALVALLLSTCVSLAARADTAQNAFVIVEGDGVVRLDGRNFATGADGEVTIRAQPGWVLDTPASVKLVSTKPIR